MTYSFQRPSKEQQYSMRPVIGSSQQILQATIVEMLSIQSTLPQLRLIPLLARHLQRRQRERLTRNGQGESKIDCRTAILKGSSGGLRSFKVSASPYSEKISLSNCELLSRSPIIIEILFFLSLQGTTNRSFLPYLLLSYDDDWESIQKFLFNLAGVYFSDSTLDKLLIDSNGANCLNSCNSVILIASAMEILLDFIMEARALLTLWTMIVGSAIF